MSGQKFQILNFGEIFVSFKLNSDITYQSFDTSHTRYAA